ncbi:hypothetical protein ACHAPT_002258 [Fusarium lateritium]
MCAYRLKPRVRARKKDADKQSETVTSKSPAGDDPLEPQDQSVYPALHSTITVSNYAPDSGGSVQLAYGPTSSFAFLQSLHDGLVSRRTRGARRDSDSVQSLDAFTKRIIFFGMPSRVDALSIPFQERMETILPKPAATQFLGAFSMHSSHALPFINMARAESLMDRLYDAETSIKAPSQDRAVLLMTLAVGALSTPQTDMAETLFVHAKREAGLFDDAATLQMVQFSLLAADYQLSMGRPNAAYLQVAMGCTRALAMGLQTRLEDVSFETDGSQRRCTTLWALYFHQT